MRRMASCLIWTANSKTATFPGVISDEAIEAEWQDKLRVAETQSIYYSLGVALLVTVVFSYLLQASYRAVLYVVYGAKAGQPVAE